MAEELKADQVRELEEQTLSGDEVQEILNRLSSRDLGGSELATVAAVSEVTGAPAELIGRMLAEIRQENLQEKFGERLDTHESKIDRLERRTRDTVRSRPSPMEREIDEEIRAIAKKRIREREVMPFVLVIFAFIVVILLAAGPCAAPPKTPEDLMREKYGPGFSDSIRESVRPR